MITSVLRCAVSLLCWEFCIKRCFTTPTNIYKSCTPFATFPCALKTAIFFQMFLTWSLILIIILIKLNEFSFSTRINVLPENCALWLNFKPVWRFLQWPNSTDSSHLYVIIKSSLITKYTVHMIRAIFDMDAVDSPVWFVLSGDCSTRHDARIDMIC